MDQTTCYNCAVTNTSIGFTVHCDQEDSRVSWAKLYYALSVPSANSFWPSESEIYQFGQDQINVPHRSRKQLNRFLNFFCIESAQSNSFGNYSHLSYRQFLVVVCLNPCTGFRLIYNQLKGHLFRNVQQVRKNLQL